MGGYPNLYRDFGWAVGAHRAPASYEHPWVAVTRSGTSGHWTREEARAALNRWLTSRPDVDAAIGGLS